MAVLATAAWPLRLPFAPARPGAREVGDALRAGRSPDERIDALIDLDFAALYDLLRWRGVDAPGSRPVVPAGRGRTTPDVGSPGPDHASNEPRRVR